MDDASASVPEDPRERVEFYLLDHRTPTGRAIDVGLLGLNLVFVAVYVAQTYSLPATVEAALWTLEVGIAVVFALEYALRLYGAPDRLAEATDPLTLTDLLSILPTLVVLVAPAGLPILSLGFLRALRVVRVLRFYRFTRDEEFFFGTVAVETLRIGKLLLTVLVVFFASAGLFYSVEVAANPHVATFGDAFYYVVITLTTVGFGDVLPVTPAGRWVTIGGVLAAVVLIPGQAGRIVREWTHRETVEVTCPNCGLASHDPDASHCKACGHVIYQEHDSR
ncbi:MAG: ion transporter [Halanaeroarchaeum sp.]